MNAGDKARLLDKLDELRAWLETCPPEKIVTGYVERGRQKVMQPMKPGDSSPTFEAGDVFDAWLHVKVLEAVEAETPAEEPGPASAEVSSCESE